MAEYQVGDWVIYRKTKHSPAPGPRAVNVSPAIGGEDYAYQVDKYWVVVEVRPDHLILGTRTGKRNKVKLTDPNLRHASFWEKWRCRRRFPEMEVA